MLKGEARQNLVAILIAFGIIAALAGFILRPAVLLGVDTSALASSVDAHMGYGTYGDGRTRTKCVDAGDRVFKCGDGMKVEVGPFGCWEEVGSGAEPRREQPTSIGNANDDASDSSESAGCIWLLDY